MMEFKPIASTARIEVVDAVRGFALFGVLLANIPFATEAGLESSYDGPIIFLYHFLIDKKFITIFSILFGFGFGIQMKRAEARKVPFVRYFMIRMLLLFLIGSLHAYILWNGDIIRAYALGGVVLLLVRNWSPKRLLGIALVFSVLITGIIFIGNSALDWRVYDYDYALAAEMPVTPSYLRYLTINFIIDPWSNFLKDLPITLAFTFGNMLLGVVMAKTDFFLRPQRWERLNNWLILLGSTVGLASSFVYYQIVTGAFELDLPLLWVPFVVVAGMLLQSLAYIALFVKLYRYVGFQKLLNFFRPVGKTSLTNYIFQSVFYLVVFFHCTQAFQLFGKIDIPTTFVIGILFFGLQTLLSYFWLKRYSQGPLEYVWKKVSYGLVRR